MIKHRTSLEVPLSVWKRLCDTIPARKRGRFIVEAIREKLDRESIKVLILCGGEGTRMRPLTLTVPKPMLPLGYKPLLQHTISYLKEQGIYNFVLALGYMGEQIIKYFEDGRKYGVKIEYSMEEKPLGTGGAIKNAQNLLTSTFITMNGDVVFGNLDIKDILRFHREKGGIGMIVLWKATKHIGRFGVVEMDKEQKIISFLEKPKGSVSRWVNAGVYVFEPKIFNYIKSRKFVSLEEEVFPLLIEREKLFGYKYEGYWADIGIPEDYERVSRDFLLGKIK